MRAVINLVCRLHISNLREKDPKVRLRHVEDPQPPEQKRAGHINIISWNQKWII